MNFGESLAYWYFRLNGFFPLTNLVLHEPDETTKYNADADLLAVRFPHVYEEIGGRPRDWDNKRFDDWGLEHRTKIVCVICEVKTGSYKHSSVNKSFGEARLRYVVPRFGIVERERADEIVVSLLREPVVAMEDSHVVYAKVLIHHSPVRGTNDQALTPCRKVSLEEIRKFVRKRMTYYKRHKGVSRMFFPSELIQYMAWEAGVPLLLDDQVDQQEPPDRTVAE